MSLNRRDFLKLAGVGAALVGASPTRAALASVQHSIPELMGKPKGKRLVILGASFGGINAALIVKRLIPDTQVVLLDKAPFFISCPATLEYLFGMVSLDTITRGYTSLHERGLEFVRTTILALDRDKKMVVCADGTVDYDYLLVATGVRMAYEDVPGLTERPRANL
jgi:NADH dehydrogenase FAD-containing subunit